jgi:hypothetical protein
LAVHLISNLKGEGGGLHWCYLTAKEVGQKGVTVGREGVKNLPEFCYEVDEQSIGIQVFESLSIICSNEC